MKRIILALLVMQIISSKMIWLGDVGNPGARYPVNDIYDGKDDPSKQGQLNSVGMRQQYLLGTYLNKDYIQTQALIAPKYYHKAIQVFACLNVDRTYDSALSRLYGVFPPGSGWTIPEQVPRELLEPPFQTNYTDTYRGGYTGVEGELPFALEYGFQPVPVWPLDSTLNDPCPNAGIIKTRRLQEISKNLTNFQKDHSVLLAKIKLVFNLTSLQMNIPSMADLYDTIMSDITLGKELPQQFSPSDLRDLKYISDYYNVLLNGGSYGKTFSTLILQAISSKMELARTRKLGEKKWSMFFPKQGALTSLLAFMNFTSPECLTQQWKKQPVTSLNCVQAPGFSSNFLIQLHEDDSFQNYVRVKYNGYYLNLCGVKDTKCSYTDFWSLIGLDKAAYTSACYNK